MAKRLTFGDSRKKADFAVIGAGNGGLAMAGHLAISGYRTNIWNRSAAKVAALSASGKISVRGEIVGEAVPSAVTTDMAEAIRDVPVIMVTVPASGHDAVARAMAGHLSSDQIVVLNPGRTGGALAFRQSLRRAGYWGDATIAEANTFVYASRSTPDGRSQVFGVKKEVKVAALPSTRTVSVVRALVGAYPQFVPARTVMETSLDNMGAIFHPIPTLLNAARVDSAVSFLHYTDGISPKVASVLERLDDERMRIAEALGTEARSALDWLSDSYGIDAPSLYQGIQANDAYRGLGAPRTLDTRYITEDVPHSLVPMAHLAIMAGVSAPVIRSAIRMASALAGEDYMETGRTAEAMGILGMSGTQLADFVGEEVSA